MKVCSKCQQEMTRQDFGMVRGWFCYDCDTFVEDDDDDDGVLQTKEQSGKDVQWQS